MITITRNGRHVQITIESGLSVEDKIHFFHDCGNETFAELLTLRLRSRFDERVESVRKEEYDRGWKHKSGHKIKERWFSSWFKMIH